MAAAAPIFTAAGAVVPCSAFRRGAGRYAAAAAAAAAAREFDDGLARPTTAATPMAAENAPAPIANSLPSHRVVAEYLYLGGSGTDMRSVTRVVEVPRGVHGGSPEASPEAIVAALPLIAVDGAATRQGAGGHCSALFLKPRSAWLDPLRGGGALLVLCEAYSPPALGSGDARDGKFSPSTKSPSNKHPHPALSPHPTNNRAFAERAARAAVRDEPLFAVTQQYLLCEGDGRPLGWTADGPPQASCYGSPDGGGGGGAGAGFCFPWDGSGSSPSAPPSPSSSTMNASNASRKGRAVADAHLAACLSAGLAVTGCRAEEASGQWSFSLGPLPPLEAADQLWAARWLLRAVAAAGGAAAAQHQPLVAVTDALPQHLARFEGRWDGNGCRVKFSTRATRDASGGERRALRDSIERLAAAHPSHMMVYGAGAALRCERAGRMKVARAAAAGLEEGDGARRLSPQPASPAPPPTEAGVLAPPPPSPPPPPLRHRFAGVEDTGAFLRIPAAVALHGRGHLEDRRPAGGCDPYMAFTLLLCTTLGLPLPLPGSGDASPLDSNDTRKAATAKRSRCGGGDESGGTAHIRRRAAVTPLASVTASGSGENQCPNQNINTNAAAASLLACDERVAESAKDEDEVVENNNGGGAEAAAAAESSGLFRRRRSLLGTLARRRRRQRRRGRRGFDPAHAVARRRRRGRDDRGGPGQPRGLELLEEVQR